MKKTTIVKIFLSVFIILALSLTGFSSVKIINSTRLSSPLNIDGSPDDWGEVALNFEKKVRVDYAFKNDGENLFVLFIFKDPKYLSSVNATGLTLWFNTEGKKKKNYGITFLKNRISADFYISYLEKQKGSLSEDEKRKILEHRFYTFYDAVVMNKKSESPSQPSDSKEKTPVLFRSKNQNKMVVYEFVIPLKRPTESAPGIGIEPGKIIKIGFEWGGMTEEMRKRMLQRQAGSERGASGAADSWYRDGTKGTVPTSSRAAKKYSFWVDVQLAQDKLSEDAE